MTIFSIHSFSSSRLPLFVTFCPLFPPSLCQTILRTKRFVHDSLSEGPSLVRCGTVGSKSKQPAVPPERLTSEEWMKNESCSAFLGIAICRHETKPPKWKSQANQDQEMISYLLENGTKQRFALLQPRRPRRLTRLKRRTTFRTRRHHPTAPKCQSTAISVL